MKLKGVGIEGFRSYGKPGVDFDFEDGLTAIVGHNGSGKSSILTAVIWCLFGQSPTTQQELFHRGASDISVGVKFEHGENEYHVVRQLHRQASGGTVPKLEVYGGAIDGALVDMSGATIRETSDRLAGIVGDWDIARATWFCGQDDGGRVLQSTPAQRRDLLSSALGIDEVWDKMHELARVEGNAIESQISKVKGMHDALAGAKDQIDEARSELERYEAGVEQSKNGVTVASREATQATEAYQLLKGRETTYNGAVERQKILQRSVDGDNAQREELETHIAGADATIARADKINADYEAALEAVTERERERDNVLARSAEMGRILDKARARVRRRNMYQLQSQATANSLASMIEQLTEMRSSDRCPACGEVPTTIEGQEKLGSSIGVLSEQVKTATAKHKAFGSPSHYGALEVQAEALATRIAERSQFEIPAKLVIPDEVDEARVDLMQAERDVKTWRDSLVVVLGRIAENQQLLDDFELPEPVDPSEVKKLLDAEALANRVLEQKRSEYNGYVGTAERARARVTLLEEQIKDAEIAEGEGLELERKLARYQITIDALSPRGARQLILDQALHHIEAEANRLLDLLRPGTRVTFNTVADSGRETLDVLVLDESGLRSWESFSGGEKTRVMFAVRVAMAHAAASAHGLHSLPAFVFDEAFGDQDDEGRAALISALHVLAGSVEQVIAITHDSDLLGRVDNVVRLEKVDGSTSVVA